MAGKKVIYQGYRCAICRHELELREYKDDNIIFKMNIECPNCSGYMKILEERQRTQVEFNDFQDPSDLFGGYLFDDREPF